MRKCEVNEKKATFLYWSEYANVIEPSPMIGGHPGGQVKHPVAVVEYADGAVDVVVASEVKFTE